MPDRGFMGSDRFTAWEAHLVQGVCSKGTMASSSFLCTRVNGREAVIWFML
ncbi:hypothetical protein ACFVVQ_03115 [Paenibacillus chitinolyticus]|uniref:hypothetical protein n=1 Tax=Paenibacillus chitinolyticus TaxID=79263 RepID=UPI0036DCD127